MCPRFPIRGGLLSARRRLGDDPSDSLAAFLPKLSATATSARRYPRTYLPKSYTRAVAAFAARTSRSTSTVRLKSADLGRSYAEPMAPPSALLHNTSTRTLSQLLRTAPRVARHISSSQARLHSVSPEEVAHFNVLAEQWWEPHGSSRLLHLMNPLRHDFIAKCKKTHGAPPAHKYRYLDIGCGGGIFAESAARLPNAQSVTAIDPTPGVLAIAEGHKKKDPGLKDKLTYINTSIEELHNMEPYDIVSVFEVIEHVNAPAAFLDEVEKHVRPGGWLIMSTIARTWVSWFTTNLMAEDILKIVPKGTHDWEKYVNCDELEKYFELKGGWGKPVIQGVVYVPGFGWKEIDGSEKLGNYFIGVRRDPAA